MNSVEETRWLTYVAFSLPSISCCCLPMAELNQKWRTRDPLMEPLKISSQAQCIVGKVEDRCEQGNGNNPTPLRRKKVCRALEFTKCYAKGFAQRAPSTYNPLGNIFLTLSLISLVFSFLASNRECSLVSEAHWS